MSGRVLILLNGELGPAGPVRRAAGECRIVVCADGGARHAAKLGLKPRLIIGDMDSLPRRLPAWRDTVYLCDFDPDCSDFEKALRFAREREFSEAWVAGGIGDLGHTLVNFAVAERHSSAIAVRFVGAPAARLLEPGSHRLPAKRGARLTLLAASDRAKVTTRGLLFPLCSEWLERGSRGLSNRATAARVLLRVHQGRVWAIG